MGRKFEYVNRVTSTGYEMKNPEFDLPRRSTKHSIAYDFFSPETFTVQPKESYMLWSGVKAQFQDDEALLLNVRSSMGKKKIMLGNTQAWIECDYYGNPDNEGEIGILLYNYGDTPWEVNKGDKIAQGMFIKYLITDDDNAEGTRNGGWGSTGK